MFDGAYTRDLTDKKVIGQEKSDYDFALTVKRSEYYRIDAYAQSFGHNISDGKTAKTGGPEAQNTLVAGYWENFVYNRARTNVGIGGDLSWNTPYFVSVKLDNKEINGMLPMHNVGGGTLAPVVNNAGGHVPYPLDYRLWVASGEVGYRSTNFIIKLDGSMDGLENKKEHIYSSTAKTAGRSYFPSSERYDFGGSVMLRLPEIKSSFTATANYSRLMTEEFHTSNTYNTPIAIDPPANTTQMYTGDTRNKSFAGAFTISPIKGLNAKIYGRYFDRDNQNERSTRGTGTISAPFTGATANTDYWQSQLGFFGYDKTTLGAEVGYRFMGDFKAAAGYEYERNRRDAYGITRVARTHDNKGWLKLNAGFGDFFSGHLDFDYLNRNSSRTDVLVPIAYVQSSVYPWQAFLNSASKTGYNVKLGVDVTPMNDLGIGLDYVFTTDSFKQKAMPLGPKTKQGHAFVADLSYSIGPVKFATYGGVEFADSKTSTRASNNAATANPSNSAWYHGAAPFGNASLNTAGTAWLAQYGFNWEYQQLDTTWNAGINGTVALIQDSLDLKLGYDYMRNRGKTKFTYSVPVTTAQAPYQVPGDGGAGDPFRKAITPVDKYDQHMLNAKITYSIDSNHSIGLGYYYSFMKYRDFAWDTNDPNTQTVTEQQKLADSYYKVNNSYEAHAVGLNYRYKF
jgi:hypothetical protein